MIGEKRISSSQLFTMLFLSKIFFLMMYSPKSAQSVDPSVYLVGEILAIPFIFIILIPFYSLNKNEYKNNIITCSEKVNKYWGFAVGMLYWSYLLFVNINTIANFEFFITTAIYPESNSTIFIVIMLLACMYACILGIEPIARMSGFITTIVIISLILILIPLLGETNFAFLHSINHTDAKTISGSIYTMIIANSDLALLYIFPNIVSGNTKKYIPKYIIGLVAFYEIIVFFTIVTFGTYAKTILFPLYSLSALSELSVLERMDSIHMVIWVFVAFIKSSVFLYASSDILSKVIKIDGKITIIFNTIIAIITSIIISKSFTMLTDIAQFFYTGILFIIFTILIPTITAICLKFKNRRKVICEK